MLCEHTAGERQKQREQSEAVAAFQVSPDSGWTAAEQWQYREVVRGQLPVGMRRTEESIMFKTGKAIGLGWRDPFTFEQFKIDMFIRYGEF